MAYETITADTTAGICRITLNRPDKLNPLSATLIDEWTAAMDAAVADATVRVICVTGAGRAFSAGADLRGGVQPGADVGEALLRHYNPLVELIRGAPKPVVAAVNGVCAGAACNLALACDIVVAARSALFIEVFSRIGLMPDAGGTYFLPRAVGAPRAMAASMLADDIPADRAHAWGMVWQVFDDDAFRAGVDALLRRLADGPTGAYAAIKRAVHASEANTLSAQLQLEADLQRALGYADDFREGVTAFLEKRQAAFTGH